MSYTSNGHTVDMARYHAQNAREAIEAYWGRSTSDTDGQMEDIRRAVEALVGGLTALALAVEKLDGAAVNTAARLDEKENQ